MIFMKLYEMGMKLYEKNNENDMKMIFNGNI